MRKKTNIEETKQMQKQGELRNRSQQTKTD